MINSFYVQKKLLIYSSDPFSNHCRVCPEIYKTDICSSLEHAVETTLDRNNPLVQGLLSKLICHVIRDKGLALAWRGSGEVIGRMMRRIGQPRSLIGILSENVMGGGPCLRERSKKFRLGVKIAPGYCEGIHIREAKTEAFNVRDHRGERNKKHYPPASDNEVWRLESIAKDGKAHKILNEAKINTVEDFRRYFAKDLEGLRNLLSCMPNKRRVALINHAKTCAPTGK
ncbi:hypothetical protein Droror1_Dr00008565, partial [Drosera rotundifolia]